MGNKRFGIIKTLTLMMAISILMTFLSIGYVIAEGTDTSVDWQNNTRNKDINIKGPSTNGNVGIDWGSKTFEDNEENKNSENSPVNSGSSATTVAIFAGLAGILGAATLTRRAFSKEEIESMIPKGNGVWIPEADRAAVEEIINKTADKVYYIDKKGFIRSASEYNENGSATFSKVLDALITGDRKVVIGLDNGWYSYNEKDGVLEEIAFTNVNDGITIGDNRTDQVVVVNDQENNEGSEFVLAHELVHALRGEYGLRNIDADNNGINEDEESNAIRIENMIRNELGYDLRRDGDSSDDVNEDGIADGDGSYGEYFDS